jgi:hypothetical protein
MSSTSSETHLETGLDGDFSTALYESAMRDPSTIPQLLSNIMESIRKIRAEREELEQEMARCDAELASLERAAAGLRAIGHETVGESGPRLRPVPIKPAPVRGLNWGSKRDQVYKIVDRLTEDKESARTPEIIAEMERLRLFKKVRGSKRQNVANTLYDLKKSGHLDSDSRGNWSLPTKRAPSAVHASRPARKSAVAPSRRKGTRPGSKRDQCAEILKSLCENETRSANRSEIKEAWLEAGLFDEAVNLESAVAGMLTHLKNYGYITSNNRGTWTWIGLR